MSVDHSTDEDEEGGLELAFGGGFGVVVADCYGGVVAVG